MPDRADVEQALAVLIADALYPNGLEAESAVGLACRVYRGWPVPKSLDADLARGVVHVTVQPITGSTRDRTRFSQEWQGSAPMARMEAAVDGEGVSFQGESGDGQ